MTDSITIFSTNAQGLRDRNKRHDVFDYLKSLKGSIYFLQDTHFIDEDMTNLYVEFGYDVYYSNFNTYSRGVAIFINKNLDFKLHSKHTDSNGNMLLLNCTIHGKNLTLANVYGPNQDTPEFYLILKNTVMEFKNPCIIAGDFNLILNPKSNCLEYLHLNNPKARETLIDTFYT